MILLRYERLIVLFVDFENVAVVVVVTTETRLCLLAPNFDYTAECDVMRYEKVDVAVFPRIAKVFPSGIKTPRIACCAVDFGESEVIFG